jgi:hypothetical protein
METGDIKLMESFEGENVIGNGGSLDIWNFGILTLHDMVSQPRRSGLETLA